MSVAGKVALITGGAQGLGKAFGEALLKRGGKVSLVDVNKAVGKKTETAFKERYGPERVVFIHCDVTSTSQLREAFQRSQETFGRLDIVANNAGIGDEDKWEKMIALNLTAVVHGTLLGMEYMRADGEGTGGVIINTGSLASLYPQPQFPVYVATKYGVLGLSQSMGAMIDYSIHKVRVNCICPGFADTDILKGVLDVRPGDPNAEMGREILEKTGILKPETVAEAFMMLVEDEKQNGAVIRITTQRGIEYVKTPKPVAFTSKV